MIPGCKQDAVAIQSLAMDAPLFTIELPLPPMEIRPNARVHWARKAAKVREYRSRARFAATMLLMDGSFPVPMPLDSAQVRITMLNRTARKMDADNLIASLKPALDGLTDAGLWTDDRDVDILNPIRGKDPDNPRIILEIWSRSDA